MIYGLCGSPHADQSLWTLASNVKCPLNNHHGPVHASLYITSLYFDVRIAGCTSLVASIVCGDPFCRHSYQIQISHAVRISIDYISPRSGNQESEASMVKATTRSKSVLEGSDVGNHWEHRRMGEVGYRDLFDEYPYMRREAFAMFWGALDGPPKPCRPLMYS